MAGGERTEAATPQRLRELRSKGQVARSVEVNTAIVMLAGLAVIQQFGPDSASRLSWLLQRQLGHLQQPDLTPAGVASLAQGIGVFFLGVMAPLFIVLPVAGVVAGVVQVGPLIAGQALVPDVQRISPLAGFQRLFSQHAMVEFGKTLLKAALVAYVVQHTFRNSIAELLGLANISDLAAAAPRVAELGMQLGMSTAIAFLGLAALDYGYQRWEYLRSARMTREEVQREIEEQEGPPEVRARIRQLQRRMATGRMMAAVPMATVVITNPTHLAVALAYRPAEMTAPRVVAKGAGLIAERIKTIARIHQVPVVENKPVAQALYRMVDVGTEIPSALFQAVAEILAYIYSLQRRRTEVRVSGGVGPAAPPWGPELRSDGERG